ncbi:MAG: hypothetical protein AABP62_16490 [Planctomycetota bacterium]
MNQSSQQVGPESVGRISQIIAGALIMGVVIFACLAFFIAKGEPANSPMIALMGAGMAVMMIVVRFVMPIVIVNGAKARLKEAADADRMTQLAGLYQIKMIVGMAVLEGAAFFNLIAYISEKQFWSYGVVAFLLGVMAISFPSQGQFESWAEEMKRDLN